MGTATTGQGVGRVLENKEVFLSLSEWRDGQKPEGFFVAESMPTFIQKVGAALHLKEKERQTVPVEKLEGTTAIGRWTALATDHSKQSRYRFSDQWRHTSGSLYVSSTRWIVWKALRQAGRDIGIDAVVPTPAAILRGHFGLAAREALIELGITTVDDPDLRIELLVPWGETQEELRSYLHACVRHFFVSDQDEAVSEFLSSAFQTSSGWKIDLVAAPRVHLGEGESIRVPIRISAPIDGRMVFALKVSDLNSPEDFSISDPIQIQAWPRGVRRFRRQGSLLPGDAPRVPVLLPSQVPV
jgi:hypothetical protein